MRRKVRDPAVNLVPVGAALLLTLLLLSVASWAPGSIAIAQEPAVPSSTVPTLITRTHDVVASPFVVSAPSTFLELFFPSGEPPALETPDAGSEFLTAAGGLSLSIMSGETFAAAMSMDWGDVDRDGDLDLAIGSPEGTAVYLNDRGVLSLQWSDPIFTLGVRWLDRAPAPGGEANLELISVGRSSDGTPLGAGLMTVYGEPELQTPSPETYAAPAQILRVEPGDYDGNGGIDLAVSTNALSPPGNCPVLLYKYAGYPRPWEGVPLCVSPEATASLAAADSDNDGDLDLALGLYESKEIRVLTNTGTLVLANSVLVADSLDHVPYDLAWGDYDGDDLLDLAAAFPIEQETRIYHNDGGGFTQAGAIPATSSLTPLAVDWGDVDGDGRLELFVADLPPKIYRYLEPTGEFTVTATLPLYTGRLQEVRTIDLDNDADLDLALANEFGDSRLFTTTVPLLSHTMMTVTTGAVQNVAWGDVDSDDYAELLAGGRLYDYDGNTGAFQPGQTVDLDGTVGILGDSDRDLYLEVALGTSSACNVHEGTNWTTMTPLPGCSDPGSLAWADYDDNGRLDLAVAFPSQGLQVYRSHPDGSFSSLWPSPVGSDARHVSWGDYDGDHWLDLAVARGSAGVEVYRGAMDGTLVSAWNVSADDVRSVAWGDWDQDADVDLAVGTYDSYNRIYENDSGVLSISPIAVGDTGAISATTSLAWGDWDNDGDLDLAVGNSGEPDQVFANQGPPGAPTLVLRWESTEVNTTNAVAWGDMDRDGDLDLGVAGGDGGGVYANNYVLPVHLGVQSKPLPRNPSYLAIERGGGTADAYHYSSSEILAGPTTDGLVNVWTRLYDPESDPVLGVLFAYSLDGGGSWIPTTNVDDLRLDTSPSGIRHLYKWNARADGAVSDSARIRITLIHGKRAGPVQRALTSTTSPPFRVRATTCSWPANPTITITPSDPAVGERVQFEGKIDPGGIGSFRFHWDLGPAEKTGQSVYYPYESSGTYTVTLTVTGEDCPLTRPVVATELLDVLPVRSILGAPGHVYLPLALRSATEETP